ncbi:hypothetical protein PISMIDRAFT_342390 [Pisolithus microcarpus 441]|uniref:Unplaced genomic scaffold scaffold_232, whole genome shotgun sequence n=1 Tax=Pisolithus microcarpus 441 TaxID=765257 RepID=A0A0C9XRL7_9AGAM|nr:hypothetical protein PISMIDRAFT_342390 [Pisolithus microcarpus 441]
MDEARFLITFTGFPSLRVAVAADSIEKQPSSLHSTLHLTIVHRRNGQKTTAKGYCNYRRGYHLTSKIHNFRPVTRVYSPLWRSAARGYWKVLEAKTSVVVFSAAAAPTCAKRAPYPFMCVRHGEPSPGPPVATQDVTRKQCKQSHIDIDPLKFYTRWSVIASSKGPPEEENVYFCSGAIRRWSVLHRSPIVPLQPSP